MSYQETDRGVLDESLGTVSHHAPENFEGGSEGAGRGGPEKGRGTKIAIISKPLKAKSSEVRGSPSLPHEASEPGL